MRRRRRGGVARGVFVGGRARRWRLWTRYDTLLSPLYVVVVVVIDARGGFLTDARGMTAAEARACGCARGGDVLSDETFRAGVEATRAKVRELNDIVVQALVQEGVDARGISPHDFAWRTRGVGVVESANMDALERARSDGAVPVLHGDVVDDSAQGTSVLSGDDIVHLCALWIQNQSGWLDGDSKAALRVVFLSNVFGCYDAPPTRDVVASEDDFDAPLEIDRAERVNLVRVIEVAPTRDVRDAPPRVAAAAAIDDEDVDARVVSVVPLVDAFASPSTSTSTTPTRADASSSIRFENAPTDVTGGAKAKLAAAVRVAADVRVDVCVTRPGAVRFECHAAAVTPALDALTGARASRAYPFLGTVVTPLPPRPAQSPS